MLETKGLLTVEDLLAYAPFRYEDRSNVKTIAQLAPGEMATVIAEVQSAHLSGFRRRNLGMFEAIFKDSSRRTAARQMVPRRVSGGPVPARAARGAVRQSGARQLHRRPAACMHPEFEILSDDDAEGDAALHTGRIVPIYEAAGKITTRAFRLLLHRILESLEPLEDHLPAASTRALETAGPLDRHPRAALSRRRARTCGCSTRSAPRRSGG